MGLLFDPSTTFWGTTGNLNQARQRSLADVASERSSTRCRRSWHLRHHSRQRRTLHAIACLEVSMTPRGFDLIGMLTNDAEVAEGDGARELACRSSRRAVDKRKPLGVIKGVFAVQCWVISRIEAIRRHKAQRIA